VAEHAAALPDTEPAATELGVEQSLGSWCLKSPYPTPTHLRPRPGTAKFTICGFKDLSMVHEH